MVGPLDLHARATALFYYDNNISLYDQQTVTDGITTTHRAPPLGDDFILSVSPGVVVTKATTLQDSRTAFSLDYSPSFIFFVKNNKENSIDQMVRFNAGYAFTKLTLGVAQDYVSTAGGVVDVGSRVNQDNYRTTANARYELTEKTFLQADGSYHITDYQTLSDSEEWSASTTVNYQFSPKTTLGLGLTVGQLFVTEESQSQYITTNKTNTVTRTTTQTQTYVGPTLRASYKTSEKTDISLSLGGEWRFYTDDSTSFGPVFTLTGSYYPSERTSLSLEAHRLEQNSAVLDGQNYISTGVSIAIRQKLRERLSGYASFSFDNLNYVSTQRGVHATRNDDYFLLRYGLDAIIAQSWTVGIFHQYREDDSSDKGFSFVNNQVGIQASWVY
jgi:hypothetical protein